MGVMIFFVILNVFFFLIFCVKLTNLFYNITVIPVFKM